MPEKYICAECLGAIAAEKPGFYNDHSCAEWGRGVNNDLPDCECPYHETWCPDCQIDHHPPVGIE
jgi:hypothetical protein